MQGEPHGEPERLGQGQQLLRESKYGSQKIGNLVEAVGEKVASEFLGTEKARVEFGDLLVPFAQVLAKFLESGLFGSIVPGLLGLKFVWTG